MLALPAPAKRVFVVGNSRFKGKRETITAAISKALQGQRSCSVVRPLAAASPARRFSKVRLVDATAGSPHALQSSDSQVRCSVFDRIHASIGVKFLS